MHSPIRNAVIVLAAVSCIGLGVATSARRQAGPDDGGCMSNLKQLGLANRMYLQDYDERIAPMGSASIAKAAVFPYVKNAIIFSCPVTSKPYRPNANLGGKLEASIASPAKTVLLFDAAPHTDGTFGVVYLDGHVIRESKAPNLAVKFVLKKAPAGRKAHSKGK